MATSAEISSIQDRIETALSYPGSRPEGSFMTTGELVTDLPDDYASFVQQSDEQLSAAGLPLISDRIPMLAYGSNASPDMLRAKMAKFGNDHQDLMQTVPHIKVTVPNVAAVWHGKPGQLGAAFAELYNKSEAQGGSLQAHVAFMTVEQVIAMHTTEGVTYSAARLPIEMRTGDGDVTIDALAYVGLKSQVYSPNDYPITVEPLRHISTELQSMTVEEVVNNMLGSVAESMPELPHTAREYMAEGTGLTLPQKKERQAKVAAKLSEGGFLRTFSFFEDSDPEAYRLIGRADLASIMPGSSNSNVHPMLEMVAGKIRSTPEQLSDKIAQLRVKNPEATDDELRVKAQNVLDPVRLVSRRAHDELAVRTATKTVPSDDSSIVRLSAKVIR